MLGQTSLTPRGGYVKQIWRENEISDFLLALLLLLCAVFFRFILCDSGMYNLPVQCHHVE
jgi:hypothetical protein